MLTFYPHNFCLRSPFLPVVNAAHLARYTLAISAKCVALARLLSPRRILLSLAFFRCGMHFCPGFSLEVHFPERISIGSHFSSGRFLRLHAWPCYASLEVQGARNILIDIGSNVFINSQSYITAAYGVRIGSNCLFGSNVLITDNAHGDSTLSPLPRISRPLAVKGVVEIGENVWLCNNVVVASGVSIGHNSIVAANSVVLDSFPVSSLIGGAPARLLMRLV